jgi:hypothetical protein
MTDSNTAEHLTPPADENPSRTRPALSVSEGIDRRASGRAMQFWRDLANPHAYPSLSQVTAESAGPLWESLFVVRVAEDARAYSFVIANKVLREALGLDPTGLLVVDTLPSAIRSRSLYYYQAAVDLRAPIDESGKWTRPDGDDVLYRTILLPLSDDQRTINYLLGAFSFRAIAYS